MCVSSISSRAKRYRPTFAASDACVVLLKKNEIFQTVIPTKMLEFMSCARPVILGVEGHARKVMEQANAGIFIRPEDPVALVDAVMRLAADPALRESLGRNGRQHICHYFSRQDTAKLYLDVLQDLLGTSARRRRIPPSGFEAGTQIARRLEIDPGWSSNALWR